MLAVTGRISSPFGSAVISACIDKDSVMKLMLLRGMPTSPRHGARVVSNLHLFADLSPLLIAVNKHPLSRKAQGAVAALSCAYMEH